MSEARAGGKTVEEVRAEKERVYPLGRIALPEEIVDLVWPPT